MGFVKLMSSNNMSSCISFRVVYPLPFLHVKNDVRFVFSPICFVRDRPFNLKGGGYVFCFVHNFFFRTTQELEYLFFLSRKARNFFPEFNIRLYVKNSESDYFFFLHQNQNIFSATLGIRIFF